MFLTTAVLKAIADETRLKIIKLLLKHNYCVGETARCLGISEAAVSQHLKVLKEAELLVGEKRGYFMHYDVNRSVLKKLASEIEEFAAIEREACQKDESSCAQTQCSHAGSGAACSAETQYFCHGIGDLRNKKQQSLTSDPLKENGSGE